MTTSHLSEQYRLSSSELWIYLSSLLVVIIAQTAHFVTYFDQPLYRSSIWAIVDWSIWFLLIFLVVRSRHLRSLVAKPSFQSIWLLPCIAILPVIHSILAQGVYSIFFEPSVSVMDDIRRQLDKKWFQSLLIVIALVFGFDFIRRFVARKPDTVDGDWILIQDGQNAIRVMPKEVRWVIVARNYLLIKMAQEESLIRCPLKKVYELLKPYGFVMISRSACVNLNTIRSIEKVSRYQHIIHVSGGRSFPIGRTYLKEVKRKVEDYSRVVIGGVGPKA